MKSCLILGSNSDMGQALAYKYASEGYNIVLASRNVNEYQTRLKNDISIKNNVKVSLTQFDGAKFESHATFSEDLEVLPDVVIVVFGYLGDQSKALNDFEETYRIITNNYLGQVSLINKFIQKLNGKKEIAIIGISSVAGDRGRKSNYIYGSAKAAFTTYLSGLRNDMNDKNIKVMTVLPGFVKTKMLGDLKTPNFLTATPQDVANQIFKAYKKQKNIIYVFPIWKYIMCIIKIIPEFKFKKMNL